jgi:hypothetical protein
MVISPGLLAVAHRGQSSRLENFKPIPFVTLQFFLFATLPRQFLDLP